MNVSNRNAIHLLELLGLPVEPDCIGGSVTAEDMLGRALVALALTPADIGCPVSTDGNLIDCGRPEGYAEARLRELAGIAEWAKARGRDIFWA